MSGNQALFALYWDGDVHRTVEAMQKDGIKIAYNSARHWAKDPAIIQAIQNPPALTGVADKRQRQEWWTKVMLGQEDGATMTDRLRASQLLGQSAGDFVQKIEHSGEVTIAAFLEKMAVRHGS